MSARPGMNWRDREFSDNGPFPYVRIPDQCNRSSMRYGEYVKHIKTCPNRYCREVLRNHNELIDSICAKRGRV